MKLYTLTPHDVLFFRDGRPIETAGGHGARWPEPSVIFDALHAALWRAFPDRQSDWEHDHRWGRSSKRLSQDAARTQRFGSLTTAGLFPVWEDGRWLFPAPADVTADLNSKEGWRLAVSERSGSTNLPASFLNFLPTSMAAPGKESAPAWWSRTAWESYLAGTQPERTELFDSEELFASEWTTGIGMDPETQTQDGTRIYSAEYLRLRDKVGCGFAASLPMKRDRKEDDVKECIAHLFSATRSIIVGGQQRACHVDTVADRTKLALPKGPPITGSRVKWVLLSPAIWPRIEKNGKHPGGWLPNWIDHENGNVMLRHRAGKLRRQWSDEKQRTIRTSEVDEPIVAKLVAARVPKPIPIVGWTERLHLLKDDIERGSWQEGGSAHGPRPTHLAVPAGAVYYFEANSAEEAAKLAAALNWHGSETIPTTIKNRRSTLMGEKGFGLGVCGTWDFYSGRKS